MRSHRGKRGIALLSGLGLGAGLMFLLDPRGGRYRRAWLRDKAARATRTSARAIGKASRDVKNRVWGLLWKAKKLKRSEQVPDDVVVYRVRSKLGRLVSHPKAIQVRADRGRVILEGAVLESELLDLMSAVPSVPGVKDVDNQLDTYKEPKDIPGLRGARVAV